MASFTNIINFIMELIDLIKKFFGSKPDADQNKDKTPDNEEELI